MSSLYYNVLLNIDVGGGAGETRWAPTFATPELGKVSCYHWHSRPAINSSISQKYSKLYKPPVIRWPPVGVEPLYSPKGGVLDHYTNGTALVICAV